MHTSAVTRVGCHDDALSQARAFARRVLDHHRVDEQLRADVQRLITELVSNAVRHARTDATITIDLTDACVRVAVRDDGPGWPRPRTPTHDGGYGLHTVDAVATQWGAYRMADTKTVWFELLAE